MLAVGLQAQMNTSLVCPSSVVTWLAAICSPVVAPLMSGRAVSVPFAAAPLRTIGRDQHTLASCDATKNIALTRVGRASGGERGRRCQ